MVLLGSNMNYVTIKVTKNAHRGLVLAKAMDGIQMTEWVSTIVLEAMQKDCPKAYEELRKEIITQNQAEEQ
jgi:hypothetical protein